MDLAGKKALVVGLAKSGLASIELLAKNGAVVCATDCLGLTELPGVAGFLDRFGVPFERQSDSAFKDQDLIVLSPGVPADLEPLEAARRRGVDVIGEVELAGQFLRGKIIGVTGSNGKTTTTALIGHILGESGVPVQVGGNIGTPVAAMVGSSRDGQWNVLELSSFQLETIRAFRVDIGVVLNVTPDHLDRHYTFENYQAAKARMLETQRETDFAVLNADDATCLRYSTMTRGRTIWFSSSRRLATGLWLEAGRVMFDGQLLLPASDIPIRGLHNVENTMAAASAARLAGLELEAISSAVRSFQGVEHRLEYVRTVKGVDFYNDSKATNVDATLKALAAFPHGLWVILGGKDKGSDYTPLRDPLSRTARGVMLIGAAAPIISAHLAGSVPLIECGALETAVHEAFTRSAPGDTVLLAPACASFDQFLNYEQRGRVFKDLVNRLEAID